MGRKYQLQDFEIVDYGLWSIPEAPDCLRGPQINPYDPAIKKVAYLGAAQTFGTMCRYPFPNLLSSMLGVASLNLGLGGAGPKKYLREPKLLDLVNTCDVAVIQVMAGRSSENSLMINPNGGSMYRWRTDAEDVPIRHSEELYKELIATRSESEVLSIVEESRDTWVEENIALANKITIPKVMLWISRRGPDYEAKASSIGDLFGGFPQLVDKRCMDAVAPHFDQVVWAVSAEGFPAPLLNRFTWSNQAVQRDRHKMKVNNYYPSQHQHIEAALQLYPVLKTYF
jgi:hypothetical protein